MQRGVAQFGSALALGARCREFESRHPDHRKEYGPLAQWLEQSAHNRSVRGSSP